MLVRVGGRGRTVRAAAETVSVLIQNLEQEKCLLFSSIKSSVVSSSPVTGSFPCSAM